MLFKAGSACEEFAYPDCCARQGKMALSSGRLCSSMSLYRNSSQEEHLHCCKSSEQWRMLLELWVIISGILKCFIKCICCPRRCQAYYMA
eukprot:1159350-Pelagomonas_calceolata.AAC.4